MKNNLGHRQAKAPRQQGDELFRFLLEHAADAFFVMEATGRIVDVNQSACDNLGYTREEFLTMSVWDMDEYWTSARFAEFWQQTTLGTPVTLEAANRRKDGTIFPVEIRAVMHETDGRQLALALVRDITERKRIEQALRESEEWKNGELRSRRRNDGVDFAAAQKMICQFRPKPDAPEPNKQNHYGK